MTLTAVDFDEMITVAAESSTLDENLLRLEQLPQIIKYFKLKLQHEKYNLVGPDGTTIRSKENTDLYAYTPLIDDPVGWAFPRVSFTGLNEAFHELLRCEEGEASVAVNPWEIKFEDTKIRPFAINPPLIRLNKSASAKISYVNPEIEILTPFFRRRIRTKEFCCTSVAIFDPDSNNRVIAVSDREFEFTISEGVVKFDREVILLNGFSLPGTYKLAWFLRNSGFRVQCKPKYTTPLIRLTPDVVFPLNYKYESGILTLTLLNLDPLPHIVTVIGSFRIRSAKLIDLDENVDELVTEFDRVKFPMSLSLIHI